MIEPVKSFLKWPGGKRWLIPHLRTLFSGWQFERYVEPFLGGGAVYFSFLPERVILSDINADLINAYWQVRDHPKELVDRLQQLPVNKQTYLEIRASDPSDSIERGVRFLYLNRTAFAGVYRLDKHGHFNVPFGGGQ